MRVDLQVPFAEKDEAKRLGARWDPAKRLWYVTNPANLAIFRRWLSDDDAPGAVQPAGSRSGSGKAPRQDRSAGLSVTGAAYLPLECDCLPWEGCSRCQDALEKRGWRR
ncbi:MAG: hypothetical protein CGU28_11925 [Candidatus Dactylopiibacterium carminicum]|uniref:DUF5710 domain-containing protein n=1 Tax=Candidatus Dactylopiibacterium carminicum TaxID=857335 RepID=A0A272EUP2_9RHOO|nr:DUF5710 domain-containing protein [Candidatus Dactylopiibacterium carminicum]KAF7600361.1 hypothetical protein BGI27_02990 [Candidatus Dactylopiibacterium carminicum]PAS93812.1 MAG: hypothetical protein CGU29_06135 [Candidatus Dactylopiibacterium carminicum]PAS95605.1 MAG: hypothetical protein CGU28_11925 [Candidatus Dactylopiibacterium carminicum]PAT00360.1 MAG: hypothetical protein BSR46_03010 [Candidatus Dactylopiibacterium carminicum]